MKLTVSPKLAARLRLHFGDVTPEAVTAAVEYSCNRKDALRKDAKRHKAGKLATRLYAPRLDNVQKAPRKLAALASQLREVADKVKP